MTLKEAIKNILLQQPGLSSTEIAQRLGKDRNNVRKAALELVAEGELRSENDGGVFRFFPVGTFGTSVPNRGNAVASAGPGADRQGESPYAGRGGREVHRSYAEPIDDAEYREIQAEAALRQLAAARTRAGQTMAVMPAQYAATLNGLYQLDPSGDLTLVEIERARLAAEKQTFARERAEAARALAVAKQRQPEPTWADYFGMACMTVAKGLEAHQNFARANAETRQPEPLAAPSNEEEERLALRRAGFDLDEDGKPYRTRDKAQRPKFVPVRSVPVKEEPRAQTWTEKLAGWLGTPSERVWK